MKYFNFVNIYCIRNTIVLLILTSISAISFAQSGQQAKILQSIKENILIPDSKKVSEEIHLLNASINQLKANLNIKTLHETQERFISMMTAWKSVEALYTAGNINEDMIDLPRYIDVFHSGNESIEKQLERSFQSQKSIESLLFKNSTRSINALEYVLFSARDDNSLLQSMTANNKQRIKIAQLINESLTQKLDEIYQFYLQDEIFVKQGKRSIEDLVNVLIDSSYKLLTWRIAEPAGLGDKYQGKPDSKRLEYSLSGGYFLSVKAILMSYQNILNSESHSDLGDLGEIQGVIEEINIVQKHISYSLDKTNSLIQLAQQNHSVSKLLISDDYIQLHRSLTRLHNSFYILLIEALGVKSKIIEADGD